MIFRSTDIYPNPSQIKAYDKKNRQISSLMEVNTDSMTGEQLVRIDGAGVVTVKQIKVYKVVGPDFICKRKK